MSAGRLLIDIEVLEFLRTLRPAAPRDLLRRFRTIGAAPDQFADYPERDAGGRDVACMSSDGLRSSAGHWDDFADRQVKILDVHPAERR